ncbi:hypothetical protein ES705_36856 [subsurface metagenome]
MTVNEIEKIFIDFKGLGGKSIKLLGEGEPLLRKDIFQILSKINDLKLTPVLFTCGDVIGNDKLANKLHGISGKEIAKRLLDLNCTIMLKYEHPDAKQDLIVNRNGYSVLRNNALKILIDLKFNSYKITRLGFGIVLLKSNYVESRKIYEFAIRNNIYPLICPIMPIGKMKIKKERLKLLPSKQEIIELKKDLKKIRDKENIYVTSISDFPGGLPCDISRTGFYIDDIGNAFVCEADSFVYNIRDQDLHWIWNRINKLKWGKYKNMRKYGLCNPKRKFNIV